MCTHVRIYEQNEETLVCPLHGLARALPKVRYCRDNIESIDCISGLIDYKKSLTFWVHRLWPSVDIKR